MQIREAMLGAALSIGVLSSVAPIEAHAQSSATAVTCFDAAGGSIGPEDFAVPNAIESMQTAVGVTADGSFGPATCQAVEARLVELGKVSGTNTTLRVGSKVLGWLTATTPTTNTSPAPSTTVVTTPETTPTTVAAIQEVACPTDVTSTGEISGKCMTAAKNLLKVIGFTDSSILRRIQAFQIEAGITSQGKTGYGTLGPKTYNAIMNGSGIAKITAEAELQNGIVVDKSDQTLKYFKNGKLIDADVISTGKSVTGENRETRTGTFSVNRVRAGWVVSTLQTPGSDPAMGDPRYFSGGQAIHSTPAAQESKLGAKASHGCVRTAENFQLQLIKDGMGMKTTVLVQE